MRPAVTALYRRSDKRCLEAHTIDQRLKASLRRAESWAGVRRRKDDRDEIAGRFGFAPEQVERDHVVSYVLALLRANFGERIRFIGGTDLARTHPPRAGPARTSTSSPSTTVGMSLPTWTTHCRAPSPVQRMHVGGEPASAIAVALNVSRATIYRVLAE